MNNLQSMDFENNYDYWIFDLDNTIYDFNLGLFRRISQRMTIYIKDFFNLNHNVAYVQIGTLAILSLNLYFYAKRLIKEADDSMDDYLKIFCVPSRI